MNYSACQEDKPPDEFSFRNKEKKLRNWSCKKCTSIYNKKWYKLRGESQKASDKKSVEKYQKEKRFAISLGRTRCQAKYGDFSPCIATSEEIKVAFSGKCHSCGVPEMELNKRLCLDHCHTTGLFRGWLCNSCNRSLGLLGDSPEKVSALSKYIERPVSYPSRIKEC